jgi:predicted nuclease of predicted toxin-antitoxin system
VRVLIDEDIDVAVGRFLAIRHDVVLVTDVFPEETKDPTVVRYAEVDGRLLVTGDRPLANRLRQQRRIPLLFLHGLYDREVDRTEELMAVIEAEARLLPDRFWMEIGSDYYKVCR